MSNINIEELRNQLQQRLDVVKIDEMQTTVNMEDVQVGIIDTRDTEETRKTYSNDLEGELLQRFDETKDYETRMKLAEQIKQERERKLMEKVKEAQRKQQEIKDEFISELKDKQAELSKKIEVLEQKILKAEVAKSTTESQLEEQKQIVIKGVKVVGEKVYKIAQDELNKNTRSIRSRMAVIRKLEHQRAETQEDFDSLDAYIKEISLEEKEEQQEIILEENAQQESDAKENETTENHSEEDLISAQEDEMWAEYRKKDEQDAKQKAMEEDKAWEMHDMMETAKEEEIEQQTQKEIKAYNDEQDKKEELDEETFRTLKAIFDKKQPKTSSQTITVKPTQKEPPKTTQKAEKKPAPLTPTIKFYSIEGIKFYIQDGEPVYEVAVKIEENVESAILKGWDNIKVAKPKKSQEILESIKKPNKYYDQNIAALLEDIDEKYGTSGLEQYIKLLKSESKEDVLETNLNIDYDFSNLGKVEKENKGIVNYIKRLANSNSKLGRASYEKAPNIFKRLWNNMKTLRLNPGTDATITGTKIRYDEYSQMQMNNGLEKVPNSRYIRLTDDEVIEALRNGKDSPDFDPELFAKKCGIPLDEVKAYMGNSKIMGEKKNKLKQYKVAEKDLKPRVAVKKQPETDKDKDLS